MISRVEMQRLAQEADGSLRALHVELARNGYGAALRLARERLEREGRYADLPTHRRGPADITRAEAIASRARAAVRAAKAWAAGDRAGWRDLPASTHALDRPQRWYVGRLHWHDERTMPMFGHSPNAPQARPVRLP